MRVSHNSTRYFVKLVAIFVHLEEFQRAPLPPSVNYGESCKAIESQKSSSEFRVQLLQRSSSFESFESFASLESFSKVSASIRSFWNRKAA